VVRFAFALVGAVQPAPSHTISEYVLYEDPSIGGEDPGGAFDDYLAVPERVASWVADLDGWVVGLTGLFDRGTSGEVEPVVVTDRLRSRGVGRLLIERVVTEAVARGYEYLVSRKRGTLTSGHGRRTMVYAVDCEGGGAAA